MSNDVLFLGKVRGRFPLISLDSSLPATLKYESRHNFNFFPVVVGKWPLFSKVFKLIEHITAFHSQGDLASDVVGIETDGEVSLVTYEKLEAKGRQAQTIMPKRIIAQVERKK